MGILARLDQEVEFSVSVHPRVRRGAARRTRLSRELAAKSATSA
jgi:hypothetical protein